MKVDLSNGMPNALIRAAMLGQLSTNAIDARRDDGTHDVGVFLFRA